MRTFDPPDDNFKGGLGPPIPKPKPVPEEKPEQWVPTHTPGYVKSTKTAAVNRKED